VNSSGWRVVADPHTPSRPYTAPRARHWPLPASRPGSGAAGEHTRSVPDTRPFSGTDTADCSPAAHLNDLAACFSGSHCPSSKGIFRINIPARTLHGCIEAGHPRPQASHRCAGQATQSSPYCTIASDVPQRGGAYHIRSAPMDQNAPMGTPTGRSTIQALRTNGREPSSNMA